MRNIRRMTLSWLISQAPYCAANVDQIIAAHGQGFGLHNGRAQALCDPSAPQPWRKKRPVLLPN